MNDLLIVPHTHPLIMRSNDVIKQTIRFLEVEHFDHAEETITK